jgi:hypothetical protein
LFDPELLFDPEPGGVAKLSTISIILH